MKFRLAFIIVACLGVCVWLRVVVPAAELPVADDPSVRMPGTQPADGVSLKGQATGPESLTLTAGPSDVDGMAEAIWQTKGAGKRNPATTPGTYKVQTKNVTAAGYHWDGVTTNTTFTIQ